MIIVNVHSSVFLGSVVLPELHSNEQMVLLEKQKRPSLAVHLIHPPSLKQKASFLFTFVFCLYHFLLFDVLCCLCTFSFFFVIVNKLRKYFCFVMDSLDFSCVVIISIDKSTHEVLNHETTSLFITYIERINTIDRYICDLNMTNNIS